jgi:hypothetical protein
MFADHIVTELNDTRIDAFADYFHPDIGVALQLLRVSLRCDDTQRYILSDQIAELSLQLGSEKKTLDRLTENMVLPAEDLWLEWRMNNVVPRDGETGLKMADARIRKLGLLINGVETKKGEPRVQRAQCVAISLLSDGQIGFAGAFGLDFTQTQAILLTGRNYGKNENVGDFCLFLVGAIAIINTPRLFMQVPSEDYKRLNIQRAKKGKPPILPHTEIIMPKDTADMLKDAHIGEHHGRRKLHHVRTFVRIKNGKVEIVRPHWRGDPSLGVANTGTAIRRRGERMQREGAKRTLIR